MTATAYTTIAAVKTSLNITASTDDALLTRIVSAASDWVDKHCNVITGGFAAAESTRVYTVSDLAADGDLVLDVPLVSLTTLTDGAGVAVPSGNIRLLPLNGVLKWRLKLVDDDFALSDSNAQISVKGKFGYSTTPSEGVAEATIMLAAWIYKRYQAALQDATANQELGSVIYSSAMPKQVVELLKPYRLGVRHL